ncbi:glycine dehydrogenase (aminomethyl-transferring) [candidate division LCP-89 bacterium B3_LCP]|uniref:Probable glycine dehydrogenase (decarboxylating) subunit 1 n=1 Tax=candidate division LCP-89 bacterium B3_LCP TaxID=2012998 RepID=A0A532V3J4_UNCL8|nr:MAG: glycine dehydrogenase (aminomethyl-transferring) [candidate division LCP-89 bacterium B3_LCP]
MDHFLPHTEDELKEMFFRIGVKDFSELLKTIPPELLLKKELNLPVSLSELEALAQLKETSYKNRSEDCYTCFMGGGAYDHFIPAAVDAIISRSEFYTAYTPYQAEVSQGTLQAIYEYQSMICALTGMDAANASHYDGATALAEAMYLACNQTRREKVLVSEGVNPHYRQVMETYAHASGIDVITIPLKNGLTDSDLSGYDLTSVAAVMIQSPNFLGVIEDIVAFSQPVHDTKALLTVSVDPISLALLEAPGNLGADIVTGEGQGLGNALNYGGPYLGIFAVKKPLMRRLPGRIIGATVDNQGRRGFVMTLQTREQHIRRDKATSNICTNESLCALAACVTLELLGEEGLKEMAELCLQKAHYLADNICAIEGFELAYKQPFFKEFAVRYTGEVEKLTDKLADKGFLVGPGLVRFSDDWKDLLLFAVTEKRTKVEMDRLVETLRSIA